MVPLVAAVNLAIDEGKHKGINPFSSVVPANRMKRNAHHSTMTT